MELFTVFLEAKSMDQLHLEKINYLNWHDGEMPAVLKL